MIDKKTKETLINQISIIKNWNYKLADFYLKPNRISSIREIIFKELTTLEKIIFNKSN